MADTGSIVSRVYGNFRGADFRGDEVNLSRSPDCLNVWKNYKKTASIETRPSMVMHTPFTATVHGVFFYAGAMLVHSGTRLYRVEKNAKVELFAGLADAESQGFIYENVFYLKDGAHYIQYDGTRVREVMGYVPTTSIARKPGGGGTVYEDVNMISPYRKNTFLADGTSKDYYLDVMNLDKDFVPVVTVNDKELDKSQFTVEYLAGKITFATPPAKPLTDGQDNVVVKFKKSVQRYIDSIMGCTLLQVFDNRVFFSGNKEYPNFVWHSSLNDPAYISDMDYYREGMDSAQIKGMVAGNNALWVFREPSEANTNVFYHTPTLDGDYGKIYPSTHSSVTIGCVGKAINFNDDIIFFSERGMEGISGDVMTEQVAAHRSSLVDRKLISDEAYRNMVLEEWEGYLLIFLGKHVMVADSRAMFQNENHVEYEFFYWELTQAVTCARVEDGILYLGTADGVYTLTGEGDLESYWVTPKDKFNVPHKLKTTNKRGCVVEAEGDVSVYVKIEDTGFELIDTYEGVTDYFVSRIKRKKWKDVQLKFYSQTRFRLETATLEAFIGGYIKR